MCLVIGLLLLPRPLSAEGHKRDDARRDRVIFELATLDMCTNELCISAGVSRNTTATATETRVDHTVIDFVTGIVLASGVMTIPNDSFDLNPRRGARVTSADVTLIWRVDGFFSESDDSRVVIRQQGVITRTVRHVDQASTSVVGTVAGFPVDTGMEPLLGSVLESRERTRVKGEDD